MSALAADVLLYRHIADDAGVHVKYVGGKSDKGAVASAAFITRIHVFLFVALVAVAVLTISCICCFIVTTLHGGSKTHAT